MQSRSNAIDSCTEGNNLYSRKDALTLRYFLGSFNALNPMIHSFM